jgi:hypothetical protein
MLCATYSSLLEICTWQVRIHVLYIWRICFAATEKLVYQIVGIRLDQRLQPDALRITFSAGATAYNNVQLQ